MEKIQILIKVPGEWMKAEYDFYDYDYLGGKEYDEAIFGYNMDFENMNEVYEFMESHKRHYNQGECTYFIRNDGLVDEDCARGLVEGRSDIDTQKLQEIFKYATW